MSVPTAALPVAMAAPVLEPLDALLMTINSNPYFIGVMMILLNLGGRFLALEVTKGQEQFFQNIWVRRFLIFVVLFMGTRNVLVAFWMTIVIVLLIGYLFNENSSLCLFHLGASGSTCASGSSPNSSPAPIPYAPPAGAPIGGLSQEETDIVKRLQDKAAKYSAALQQQQQQQILESEKKVKPVIEDDLSATYWQNISMLQKGEGFMNPRF